MNLVVPVVIIAIVIVVIILFATGVFSGGSKTETADTSDKATSVLMNPTADDAVELKLRGRINADEDHSEYEIRVTPTERVMTVYSGYSKRVAGSKTYGNNLEAFREFSAALGRLGMMSGEPLSGDANNTDGVCPDGKLSTMAVFDGDHALKTLWHTSCSKDTESFAGKNYGAIEKMFTDQIPDYDKLMKNTKF
jgi:hypothetical protein